ncbi:MAG: bacillithiol system redox-active protein YtxJ [Flavobacteriales bacterium]
MHERWKPLESLAQLDDVIQQSHATPQVIFKHSTRCIISKMVLAQFEEGLDSIPSHVNLLFLDLLNHRDISNAIASQLSIHHESPQVVIVKNGMAVFHESHHSIDATTIAEHC